nr:MAG TPA: hypothetical protein [Caudoviricetes sp.]
MFRHPTDKKGFLSDSVHTVTISTKRPRLLLWPLSRSS